MQVEHQRDNYDVRRWYRTQRWQRLREQVLAEALHHACALCHGVFAQLEVDHIERHGGDERMFFDRTNLQAVCKESFVGAVKLPRDVSVTAPN